MAINPSTAFSGRITAATTAFPYGSSKNETSPGAGDGTPYNKTRADDIFGFQQALLKSRGIVPSGNADEVRDSQYLQALIEYASGAAAFYTDSGAADAYVADPVNADSQGPSQYYEGLIFEFTVANTNTGGAATVDLYGLGNKSIKTMVGANPPAGSLYVGQTPILRYDGTDCILIGVRGIQGLALPLAFSFASDADDALTADENLYSRIEISGSTLTTARALTVAGPPRYLSVKNGEGFTVTVQGSSGVPIPAGESLNIYYDGTNVILPEDVISDGANTLSKTNIIAGSAKAWAHFNGTGTAAIVNSHNVTSLTDAGTGNWTLNFASAMPNNNYSTTFGAPFSGGASSTSFGLTSTASQAVGSVATQFISGGVGSDQDALSVTVHSD